MDQDELSQLALLADHAMLSSYVRGVGQLTDMGVSERTTRIATLISQLGAGDYLIGCGPYFSQIVKVGPDEITFGRYASAIEQPHEEVSDYHLNDALLLGPREVSRLHLRVRRVNDGGIEISDANSSTGTWIIPDGNRLEPEIWHELPSGTVFCLGPSGTNVFLAVSVT